MGLRVDVDEGLVLLSADPYEERIVDEIRALPERHYRRTRRDWIVPARREHLREVSALIGELEELDVDIEITDEASVRLARIDVGRAMLRDGVIEIVGSYSLRRLPGLRGLPERRFDAERKLWVVSLARAGALAILSLADETDELLTTRRARRALLRSAAATPAAPAGERGHDGPLRQSPVAHWRHFTSGPVFDNPARPRVDVPGVGLCVRVRVNPRRVGPPVRDRLSTSPNRRDPSRESPDTSEMEDL